MKHLLSLLFALPLAVSAQLTLEVTSIPSETPAEDVIYASGSFEGWSGGVAEYALTETSPGVWSLTFDPAPGLLEYKFTRGSWPTVEGNANGGFLPNRTVNYTGEPLTESLTIQSWEDLGGSFSTAADNVQILDAEFYIPELDRMRRVWIYLPPDYETTDNHYKVLYMQDGQNVFDAATSFSGEWEVDETLNALFDQGDPGCIVVAVDNGGIHRLDEYSPWENPDYGGGEGAAYATFLAQTLKPYIDENFRTLPEREWTGVMGSSMGGLISTYTGVEHSEVFSRIGAFSPSYWFSANSFDHVASTEVAGDMRVYTIVGTSEGESMTAGVEDMEQIFAEAGYGEEEHTAIEHADGQHSEWYWAREFAAAYLWLWPGSPAKVTHQLSTPPGLHVWPNPVGDTLHIEDPKSGMVSFMALYDAQGNWLHAYKGFQREIDLAEFNGILILRVTYADGSSADRRILRLP